MEKLFLSISKYILLLLMALYTFLSFYGLGNKTKKKISSIFARENLLMFLTHFIGYLVIYMNNTKDDVIILYLSQLMYFVIVIGIFPILYERINKILLSNMCMFLTIGFIMIARLNFDKCVRQFEIVAVVTLITMFIPFILRKVKIWDKLTWLYCISGIVLLLVVFIIGTVTGGAKLSIEIGNIISVQPSEFVKIIFVFFAAAALSKAQSFKDIVVTSVLAAAYVMILVLSTDLGSALIFFIMYICMLYIATRKIIYMITGFVAGSGAAIIAYYLFSHVQTRVTAWLDPWSVIDNEGYQITQSLFAIGSGGWLGSGLYQGLPGKIPVVEKDFIFSAIAEEFGGFFALLLILLCLCCLMNFIYTAMKQKDLFYKLIALGLGVGYAIQVILTIGGAIKMIPSTGVTLPLVSYGGSSALSTLIIFAIIQGLTPEEEVVINGQQDKKTEKKKTK
ncbi:MAG: FtsW/RodA/SpoVE family cell cycle protein [Eubacterium sp.]